VQGFVPTDRMTWPIYEVIAEHKLPAVFHSGHSGIGSGMRCGGGLCDFPVDHPERWMADFEEAGFKDKVEPLILKDNAKRRSA
jgi:predicted TIM-barrel fold metal-dependent hydrolase